jgi:hypothetical protein
VTRTINVSIVTVRGLILDVSSIDRDSASFLFRCVIDGSEIAKLIFGVVPGEHFGDSGSQGSFAVVDVTDGSHVDVGF